MEYLIRHILPLKNSAEIGSRVGATLAERHSYAIPRLIEQIDFIKFICKDLWVLLFNKPIDHLKTNHRGVYVLTDNNFVPMASVASCQPSHLYFYCGIIKGALGNLGIESNVTVEVNLPTVIFSVKIPKKD